VFHVHSNSPSNFFTTGVAGSRRFLFILSRFEIRRAGRRRRKGPGHRSALSTSLASPALCATRPMGPDPWGFGAGTCRHARSVPLCLSADRQAKGVEGELQRRKTHGGFSCPRLGALESVGVCDPGRSGILSIATMLEQPDETKTSAQPLSLSHSGSPILSPRPL